MTQLNRRSLITGLISLVAAPAIVRAGSLMPVKMIEPIQLVLNPLYFEGIYFWVEFRRPEVVMYSVMDPTQWQDLH